MKWQLRDFSGGPVVKSLCFHYRGLGFIPRQVTKSSGSGGARERGRQFVIIQSHDRRRVRTQMCDGIFREIRRE